MKKVCFVIPPSAFLLDERVFVSLGALKVAAAHRARGNPVEVLDLSGVANYGDAIASHVYEWRRRDEADPPAYAITATTPQMPAVAIIVRCIAGAWACEGLPAPAGWVMPADQLQRIATKKRPQLIIGGPHPTLVAAAAKLEAKRHGQLDSGRACRALAQLREMFDVVVAGDGEDAIEQALRLEHGLVDADDPKGPLFLTSKRLTETPWPARDLVDLDSYHYKIDGVKATSLVAQLGCPFGCTFCGGRNSAMLRRIRTRPNEDILAELEHLHTAHGYQGFMFYDDELNVNKSLVDLMRGISALAKKHGTEFRLRGFVKAELFTAEQAEVMYEAGFRWLLTGFESGSPRILENIKKKATVQDNDRCIGFAHAAGLKVKALMSIGHAGESAETIEETKQWILRLKPADFDCTIITPYPGSPYYDDAVSNALCLKETKIKIPCARPPGHGGHCNAGPYPEDRPAGIWTYTAENGDRLHAFEIDYNQEADYYKGKPGGGYVSHVFTDHLSPEDLVRLRDELESSVRAELKIPFNAGAPGVMFEASMGQTKLPPTILRSSEP